MEPQPAQPVLVAQRLVRHPIAGRVAPAGQHQAALRLQTGQVEPAATLRVQPLQLQLVEMAAAPPMAVRATGVLPQVLPMAAQQPVTVQSVRLAEPGAQVMAARVATVAQAKVAWVALQPAVKLSLQPRAVMALWAEQVAVPTAAVLAATVFLTILEAVSPMLQEFLS